MLSLLNALFGRIDPPRVAMAALVDVVIQVLLLVVLFNKVG